LETTSGLGSHLDNYFQLKDLLDTTSALGSYSYNHIRSTGSLHTTSGTEAKDLSQLPEVAS